MKTHGDMLEGLLTSFGGYYTVRRNGAAAPFAAEAEFHSHTEQYILIKAARIADIDSNEFVFFADEEELTQDRLRTLDERAWEEGLSRVRAGDGHRNSDISLIILCDRADRAVLKAARRLYRYKSYQWGFKGWSGYRLAVWEAEGGTVTCNRLGRNLKATIQAAVQAAPSLLSKTGTQS